MNTERDRTRLSKLTEREVEVLRALCDVLRNRTITKKYVAVGTKLVISEGTVKRTMDSVFIKLDIHDYSRFHRMRALTERFCPLLGEMEQSSVSSGEGSNSDRVSEGIEGIEQRQEPISEWQPPSQSKKPRGLLVGLAGGLLVAVCLICCTLVIVGYFLIFDGFPWTPEPSVVVGATPTASRRVQATPTKTKTATRPVTQEPVVVATDTPTRTPRPTASPTATPVPSPSATSTSSVTLPFEDNFDDGARPEWRPISGNWRTINGQYIATDPSQRWVYCAVGDPNWKDYVVEVDYSIESDYYADVAIFVRAGDKSGLGLLFQINGGWNSGWYAWEKMEWSKITSGEYPGSSGHIKVEVKGSTFTASVDGLQKITITDDSTTSGYVGIASSCRFAGSCPTFDNFKVTQTDN